MVRLGSRSRNCKAIGLSTLPNLDRNMNDLILVESASARNEKLTALTQDAAFDHLNKAKSLVMAMWQGTGIATTEQLADYYEIPAETVKTVLLRHRDEFDLDGLREIKGKDLKALQGQGSDILNLPEKTTRLNVWTPRAALRLGMLLRDSAIAKQVRTVLLDLAMIVPQQQEHINELQLRLELAQAERDAAIAQKTLLDKREAINQFHNETTAALILGAQIVDRVDYRDRTLTSDGQVYDGVGITYLQRRYGFRSTTETWKALESVGLGKDNDQAWKPEIAAVTNLKLKHQYIEELDRLFSRMSRQKLIGEQSLF